MFKRRILPVLLASVLGGCAPTYFRCFTATEGACYDFQAGYSEAQAREVCVSLGGSLRVGSSCESYSASGPRVGRCTESGHGLLVTRNYYEAEYTAAEAMALCPPALPVPGYDYVFTAN